MSVPGTNKINEFDDDFELRTVVEKFLSSNQVEFKFEPSEYFIPCSSYKFEFAANAIRIRIDECGNDVDIFINNIIRFEDGFTWTGLDCLDDEHNAKEELAKRVSEFLDNTFVVSRKESIA